MGAHGTNHGSASGKSQAGKRLIAEVVGRFDVKRVRLTCGHVVDVPYSFDKRKVHCGPCESARLRAAGILLAQRASAFIQRWGIALPPTPEALAERMDALRDALEAWDGLTT